MKLNLNQSESLTIYANRKWNQTGIEIQNGEAYKFVAEGTWRDLLTKCDANGYSNAYMRLYNKWKRSEENKWFALMGSINQTTDFLIVIENEKAFNQGGEFFCYANDVNGFYWNNFGEISLTITRVR